MRWPSIGVLALALFLSGCGDTFNQSSPVARPTPLELGRGATYSEGSGSVMAVEYLVDVDPRQATEPGSRWDALKVRTCAPDAVDIAVGWDAWTLIGDDGGRYGPSDVTFPQFPKPEYPLFEGMLLAGECVTGWIVFPVIATATVTGARYETSLGFRALWSFTDSSRSAA